MEALHFYLSHLRDKNVDPEIITEVNQNYENIEKGREGGGG